MLRGDGSVEWNNTVDQMLIVLDITKRKTFNKQPIAVVLPNFSICSLSLQKIIKKPKTNLDSVTQLSRLNERNCNRHSSLSSTPCHSFFYAPDFPVTDREHSQQRPNYHQL
ncbi:hypothetical protein OUZ56_028605 [Daphnia magna]|uniref:Uncharacterized protein n=1 Tax=Daphnia magna TaxID=35525 RepID=A0ABR0B4H7_9CRUS|nr:hypothetical protein OUZ56_028605 [Daphnia magna]